MVSARVKLECSAIKHKSPPVNPSQHPTTQFQNDRNFNLVIYGIAELPLGTSRHERVTKDTEEVTNIFEKITPSFSGSTLRDCHRLGHYKKNHSRPRPILAKLNRVLDVANILSNNSSYPSTISIKPDLSPEERSCEYKLLAERWHLIQSGVDRKSIKIRRPSIYVNGKLHGCSTFGGFSCNHNVIEYTYDTIQLTTNIQID